MTYEMEEKELLANAEFPEEEREEEKYDPKNDRVVKNHYACIREIPVLSAEEELELARLMAEEGEAGIKAKEKFTEHNLRLVLSLAGKYSHSADEFDDAFQDGCIGLKHAVDKFDYTKGYRFSTYAYSWIVDCILRGKNKMERVVSIPDGKHKLVRKIYKTRREMEQETLREVSWDDVAKRLNMDPEEVKEALGTRYSTVSLDTPVGEDGDTTFGELYVKDDSEEISEASIREEFADNIFQALKCLNERERKVIICHFGLGGTDAMTYTDIARLPEFGVSLERIRQIEQGAFMKLRKHPRWGEELRTYLAS